MSPRSAPPTQTYTHVHAHAQARAHTHMHTRQKYLVALGVDWRRPLRAMEFRECTCGASVCEATRTIKLFRCIHMYLSVSVCVSVRLNPYISIHSSIHTSIYPHTYLSICRLLVDTQGKKGKRYAHQHNSQTQGGTCESRCALKKSFSSMLFRVTSCVAGIDTDRMHGWGCEREQ